MIRNECIKSIFTMRDKDWEEIPWTSSVKSKLEKLHRIIPESTYYFKEFDISLARETVEVIINFMEQKGSKGYVFYTIGDGDGNLHCYAIKEEIKYFPLLLSKYKDVFGIKDFWQEIAVGDMENNLDLTEGYVQNPYEHLKLNARAAALHKDLELYKKGKFSRLDKNTLKWLKQKYSKENPIRHTR